MKKTLTEWELATLIRKKVNTIGGNHKEYFDMYIKEMQSQRILDLEKKEHYELFASFSVEFSVLYENKKAGVKTLCSKFYKAVRKKNKEIKYNPQVSYLDMSDYLIFKSPTIIKKDGLFYHFIVRNGVIERDLESYKTALIIKSNYDYIDFANVTESDICYHDKILSRHRPMQTYERIKTARDIFENIAKEGNESKK